MPGKLIEFESAGALRSGYLALPATPATAGVLVIQEWWGLVPHIKNVADRFAAAGYAALAPDLYNGRAATEPNAAQKLMQELNIAQAATDMAAAAALLRTWCKRVGCVGFCLGGGLTLRLAAMGVIDAAVPYYGVVRSAPDWYGVRCPILGHYAADDSATDALPELRAALAAAGKPAQFHIYPGTGHAFFNDERPQVYNAAAALLSWQRTLQFLGENLG